MCRVEYGFCWPQEIKKVKEKMKREQNKQKRTHACHACNSPYNKFWSSATIQLSIYNRIIIVLQYLTNKTIIEQTTVKIMLPVQMQAD